MDKLMEYFQAGGFWMVLIFLVSMILFITGLIFLFTVKKKSKIILYLTFCWLPLFLGLAGSNSAITRLIRHLVLSSDMLLANEYISEVFIPLYFSIFCLIPLVIISAIGLILKKGDELAG